jgi:hypothetical protein
MGVGQQNNRTLPQFSGLHVGKPLCQPFQDGASDREKAAGLTRFLAAEKDNLARFFRISFEHFTG